MILNFFQLHEHVKLNSLYIPIPYALEEVWTSTDLYRSVFVKKLALCRRESKSYNKDVLMAFTDFLNILLKNVFFQHLILEAHIVWCRRSWICLFYHINNIFWQTVFLDICPWVLTNITRVFINPVVLLLTVNLI